MNDTGKSILEELGEDPFLCSLATVTADGRPWVRFVRATIDEHLVLRVPTFAGTKKLREIEAQPEVHVTCGSTDPTRPGSYFQIEGRAAVRRDAESRRLAWTDHLAKWFRDPDDPGYAVVVVRPHRITRVPIGRDGRAEVWSR